MNAQESTYYLGLGNSIAGIIIFIISPLLGAISDKGENKKRFLFFFASLGIIACAFLAKIPMGQWQILAIFLKQACLKVFFWLCLSGMT